MSQVRCVVSAVAFALLGGGALYWAIPGGRNDRDDSLRRVRGAAGTLASRSPTPTTADAVPSDPAFPSSQTATEQELAGIADEAVRRADVDLEGALNWLSSLPRGPLRLSAHVALCYVAARVEPDLALLLAADLPREDRRDDMIAFALAQWAAKQPNEAHAWLTQLPAGPRRDELILASLDNLAISSGGLAANLACQCLGTKAASEGALRTVVALWARGNPAAAARWIEEQPRSNLREIAVRALIEEWVDHDREMSAQWLFQIRNQEVFDAASTAYLEASARRPAP